MSIVCADGVFHLRTKRTSYVFEIFPSGQAVHLYWGRALKDPSLNSRLSRTWRAFSPKPDFVTENFSLDLLPMEFPSWGNSDFRSPAIELEGMDGDPLLQMVFQGCRISPGKPHLAGLPATYVEDESEAQTLEIDFLDEKTGLLLSLQYSVFEELDAITRSVRVQNSGTSDIVVRRLLSMSVDLPQADLDWLQLSGAWARERHPWRQPLRPGIQSVESRRGASSHQQNPFAALLSRDATEDRGDVYGVSLVYSGNFLAQAEVDSFSNTRLQIGINPFHFSWKLSAGETFQTPEAVLVFSDEGLGGMSRVYHRLYRTRLCRGKWRDRARPILLNNWEATYFDFTEEKILEIAKGASELGMELFVLDDGWFGKRNDDKSSLGDWFVNKDKLPGGLESLVEKVSAGGMLFGLWFEPEMVSPDSELYRQHPCWCLHMPDRPRTKARSQLVLDLSRSEVREAVIKMVSDVLRSAPISYVKWDMNRHMSEVGSAHLPGDRQKETAHRYMLGLYEILERLTAEFPEVLFESCSGGGGRFDPGMLYYMPQTWTSDNSDAISRLRIQYGTSLVYPLSSMGAHVSVVPNHQTHRITSLATRGLVAMSGNFGYELDVALFTEEERALAVRQVKLYKEIRDLVQTGNLYRLKNPFEGDDAAWIIVSADRSEAVAFHFSILCEANCPEPIIRLAGLDPSFRYRVDAEGPVLGGDQLMYAGLRLHGYSGDFQGNMWRLKKIE
jgi:alpha-galactosidase